MKAKLVFERLGRNVGPTVELEGKDADELATDLYQFVVGAGRWKPGKRWVMSSEVAAFVDLEKLRAVVIVGGVRSAGFADIEVVEP